MTDYVDIPRDFLKLHKYANLVAGVMFFNIIPFLITISLGIRFITVEHVPTCTAKQLSKIIRIILSLYAHGNMIVKSILMGMEFDKTIDEHM